ncbi:DEAD/DEAH box helicase family protein [Clostridium sp. DL1XJH146]
MGAASILHKEIEKSDNCIVGGDDHLYDRLEKAFEKATKVDIIVSFIMESGVRLVEKDLNRLLKNNIPTRILTGNYLNITQPSALYLLKDIFGDKVDLRFYKDRSRSFHPKAYIFHHEDGGEIFIGSSNISKSALTRGIEWNFRIDKDRNEEDFNSFLNTFENLFYNESRIIDDKELKKYSDGWVRNSVVHKVDENEKENNNRENNIDKRDRENREAGKDGEETIAKVRELYKPRGAQIEALYHLKNSRLDGEDKGLVAAATGLGKTYLAAFDSVKFERILFVAHREEILKQAKRSFENVRPDAKTGFFYGDKKDKDCDILFATVQTLGKKGYLNEENFKRDYFDYIVVDEFHHAVAKNYRNIIDYFKPKFLLGLTATPYRMDNKDVFAVCDYNIIYEVGLKGAINKGWLVPFRYYGIYDDSIDYNTIEYKYGKYNDKQLEEALMIKNRANLVLNNYKKFKSARAMGFCSSRKHAEYMAKFFVENGVPACAVYSGELGECALNREEALGEFTKGIKKVLFSVDMFNEGLDIPSVDLIMLLRPTESPTIFFQQLGRGLRKYKDKKYLNVIDFIGNYKKVEMIPFLLTGDKKIINNQGKTKKLPTEEDYPVDCLVDFQWQLVDIFKKQENQRKNKESIIIEDYLRVKELVGHTPSRVEMLTYMDDDIYENMRKQAKLNIFKNYLRFLKKVDDLEEDKAKLLGTKAERFLNMIEKTSMSKTYKMPILLAFYNDGKMKLRINGDDIYRSMRDFYDKGSNGVDMLKDKSTKDFKSWGKDEYVRLAWKNPVKFLSKTENEFFYVEGEEFCVVPEMGEFVGKGRFLEEFWDCVEFRVGEYYRGRFIELYKKNEIKIDFALRDEQVNIFAMTKGGLKGKYSHQIMLCKKSKIPANRKIFLLDSKKSKSIFGLSEGGKEYSKLIQDEELELQYVAIIDKQIKIKPSIELFTKICDRGLFSVWDPKAPMEYFKDKEEGYLVLFRVGRISEEVSEELLHKGRNGRNFFFGLSEKVVSEVEEWCIGDREFEGMEEEIVECVER